MIPSYRILPTPGRSRFDAYRWRCFGAAESCGPWYSAMSYARAARCVVRHMDEVHQAEAHEVPGALVRAAAEVIGA